MWEWRRSSKAARYRMVPMIMDRFPEPILYADQYPEGNHSGRERRLGHYC